MNRRALLGALGVSVGGAILTAKNKTSAQETTPQPIAERLVGRRIRVYTNTLDSFFLGTVDKVEGSLIYLKDVRVPLTEPARDALIDTRSVRLITILSNNDK